MSRPILNTNAPPRYPTSFTMPSPSPPSIPIVISERAVKDNESPYITGTPALVNSFNSIKDDTCETIREDIVEQLKYHLGRTTSSIDNFSAFMSTSMSVRKRLIDKWNETQTKFLLNDAKFINYLSLEWLQGRSLTNALTNLNLRNKYAEVLENLGVSLEQIAENEVDAALGNGGLGRLAACFIDSLATTNYPCWGYGLRYSFGMFKQLIQNGEQVEVPEYWLNYGSDHVERIDVQYNVQFGGHVEKKETHGKISYEWVGGTCVRAVAYDAFVPGYGTDNVLNLRLWAARAPKGFDLVAFNHGDYFSSVRQQMEAENLTSVLYPDDSTVQGRQLRLKQQYFFVCATVSDILNRFSQLNRPLSELPNFHCIQLNDTHPVLAIPELLRQLIDLKGMEWDDAWDIATRMFFFTNHTLMSEALERWPVSFFEFLLPRHLEILYLMNHNHLENCRQYYEGKGYPEHEVNNKMRELSMFEHHPENKVRMAHIAVVTCSKVNGVAQLHAELMKQTVFAQFVEFYGAEKFVGITNGVTFRRWLKVSNPPLCNLISSTVGGDEFLTKPYVLQHLESYATDANFQMKWKNCRTRAKKKLAKLIKATTGITVSEHALFDVHVKRIHEYKRQLMNILYCIYRYKTIKANPTAAHQTMVPRVVIFAGKSASAYHNAKKIIKLINSVANVVNNDPEVGDLLKIVFIPGYGVSIAEIIIPGTDLCQQISTAGTEASGTSNMKFCLNGTLLIATLDGANIEIKEKIGEENCFIFGLLAKEVDEMKAKLYNGTAPAMDSRLAEVLNDIRRGHFGTGFESLVDSITGTNDHYLVCQDFPHYVTAQQAVDHKWQRPQEWFKSSILSTARSGFFSSDRSVSEYANILWGLKPMAVNVKNVPRRKTSSASLSTTEEVSDLE
ncbi:hypothetical protein RCL1_003208 [Eukaryota sp. TZLM3-RCL]